MLFLKGTMLALAGAFLFGTVAAPVYAEAAKKGEKKVVGILIKVVVAEDGASAVATLKSKGKKFDIQIADQETLKKFENKKIKLGDEIRCEYDEKDGVRSSVSFKRTAGC